MKRLLLPLGAAASLWLSSGCDKVREARNTYSAVVTTTKAAQEMAASLEAAQARQAARRQRGDTLAISYQELQRYLPASPAGYAPAGPPDGQSTNMNSVHISTASRQYQKGAQTLQVALVDYNGAAALFAAATGMMNGGLQMENDEQLVRSFRLAAPGVKGVETLDKKEHKATVTMGVGERFLVTVEASDQRDTELVKSVARSLDLGGLARR